MIGVISKGYQKPIVEEFFQLFKVPWEFYSNGRTYDIVIMTDNSLQAPSARLVIIFSPETTTFDIDNDIKSELQKNEAILEYNHYQFPIYQKCAIFQSSKSAHIKVKDSTEMAAIVYDNQEQRILRIGYDLFDEITFLLSEGQPAEYAQIPALEIHISMLRNWILNSGIPLIEIPPVPAGYTFMACLTHDVDFVGIRNHKFDHTMFGFIYRALILTFIAFLRRRTSYKKLIKNWKAVLSLPFVYLGIMKDFMVQFDRYIKIEEGLSSTFFVVPHKNRSGQRIPGQANGRRAVQYDITDIRQDINRLVTNGCEVGVHGIDAWQDSEKGHEELKRIINVIGESDIGVRMHWLYYCDRSPQNLEKAGFLYDSTFGYNDAAGFRGGTTQVFRPLGAQRLLELPLHIQDTALFYPQRMALTETRALELVKELFKKTTSHGGVLTINWHHRSLGPERLWDDFYIILLEELKKLEVWFGTAGQIIKWFKKRRSVSFSNVSAAKGQMHIQVTGNKNDGVPDMILRMHYPGTKGFKDTLLTGNKKVDITFTDELDTAISSLDRITG